MKKRVAKRKRAGTAGLPELLDQLKRTLPMLPDAAAPRPDGRDLTRRLGQIRAGLHARAVRRSPARRPRQPAAGSLPLFF
jgi:hypothetical protein